MVSTGGDSLDHGDFVYEYGNFCLIMMITVVFSVVIFCLLVVSMVIFLFPVVNSYFNNCSFLFDDGDFLLFAGGGGR